MSAKAALVKTLRQQVSKNANLSKALDEAKAEFNARKSLEWARIRESVIANFDIDQKNFQIRHALLDLRDHENYSIAKLCALYGTKDRRTIMRLIEQAREERNAGIRVGKSEDVTITHVVDDQWTISVENYSQWETSDSGPYTGSITVRYEHGEDFPIIDEDLVPEHEMLTPLYRELSGASVDAPIIKEWIRCTSNGS